MLPPLPPEFDDFRRFLFLIWRYLGLPNPTPVQYDIAHWLQHGPKRAIIEGFRGVAKSWITSAYVLWRLRQNPQLNFLVVSASKERADSFSTFALRLVNEVPVLQCLAPKTGQRCSMVAFDVAPAEPDHAPSVKSVGIFGQMTGSRADEIVADDIEVANNSDTQLKREKLSEAVKEFDAILKPGDDKRILFLGTPQTEASIYNSLRERGYRVRVWPARYPLPAEMPEYTDTLSPHLLVNLENNPALAGSPTDPTRFDDLDLTERAASYGKAGWMLQFMLSTSLSDSERYPLKLSDLIVLSLDRENGPEKLVWSNSPDTVVKDLPCVGLNSDHFVGPAFRAPTWLPYTGCVMFIDPAGRGRDEMAYAVVAMLNGYLFLLASGGIQGGPTEANLKYLASLAQTYNVTAVRSESNFGDGMFNQLFRPILTQVHPCVLDEVRHSQQKEKRIIDTLEPVMARHKLVVDPGVIRADFASTSKLPAEHALKYQLFYQMSRITRDKGALLHDDRLDALAGAVNFWTEMMAQDANALVRSRINLLMDRELSVFMGDPDATLDRLALGVPFTPTMAPRRARLDRLNERIRKL